MTSAELEVRQEGQPSLLEQKVMYARYLAKSDLLPQAYRAKPENVLLAIEAGEALGVRPLTAINMIHVIQGKPTISSGLMAALVRQAGHRLRVSAGEPGGTLMASATLYRTDDPEFAFTSTWDLERARNAGLTGKDSWKHYPLAMLKARAISEVCRDACPEVLAGIAYTPEELGEAFLTDPERHDAGLMTTAQRVEHNGLRRMNEPAPGEVVKLDKTPDDDPFYTEARDDDSA